MHLVYAQIQQTTFLPCLSSNLRKSCGFCLFVCFSSRKCPPHSLTSIVILILNTSPAKRLSSTYHLLWFLSEYQPRAPKVDVTHKGPWKENLWPCRLLPLEQSCPSWQGGQSSRSTARPSQKVQTKAVRAKEYWNVVKDLVSSIGLFLYPGGEWSLRRDSANQRSVQDEPNCCQPPGLTSSAPVLWGFRQLHADTEIQVPGFGAESHPRSSVNLLLSEAEEQLWMVPVHLLLCLCCSETSGLAAWLAQHHSLAQCGHQTPSSKLKASWPPSSRVQGFSFLFQSCFSSQQQSSGEVLETSLGSLTRPHKAMKASEVDTSEQNVKQLKSVSIIFQLKRSTWYKESMILSVVPGVRTNYPAPVAHLTLWDKDSHNQLPKSQER